MVYMVESTRDGLALGGGFAASIPSRAYILEHLIITFLGSRSDFREEDRHSITL